MEKYGRVAGTGRLASDVGRNPPVHGGRSTPRNPEAVPPETNPAYDLRLGCPMHATTPHYLLYSDANQASVRGPQWRFVLQSIGDERRLVVADTEADVPQSRLELLAVVRGLEALPQPSRVTLLTASRYVHRGIRHGLPQWRDRQWRWEHFGQLVPVRDHDLWQRVDRALAFHQLECCPLTSTSPYFAATNECVPQNSPGDDAPHSTALLVVPRPRRQSATCPAGLYKRISRTFHQLRHRVLTPLAAFWRPAFTRAA